MRERLEPLAPMPTKRGRCDWCGGKPTRGSIYCSPDCRRKYNNLLAAQGKTVMQMLKIWRKHRGGKGTPGEGLIGEICSRLDIILAQDRERMAGAGGDEKRH